MRDATVEGIFYTGFGVMGSKDLSVCALCASVVPDDGRLHHSRWHATVVKDLPGEQSTERSAAASAARPAAGTAHSGMTI